ncbi:MAG: aspartate aminotransferase family protein [Deltaproteobacteria bacterium]|nr:aspartate aminotransferase family protein [Deltaproteobacteria bacterium]
MSEAELAKLSYPNAPCIVTSEVPGPEMKKALDRSFRHESLARGAGRFPMVYSEGMGSTVKDPDGNVYIDITAGVAVNSVGRLHPRVIAAIEGQLGRLIHAIDATNLKRIELAEKVCEVMPEGLRGNCATYFTQSGSSAVETAIKFVRKITGRTQILAFHGAYHGVWLGANSLTTGDQYRKGYGPFMPGAIHAPYPYCYRCCFGLTHPECNLQCAKYVDYLLNTPYTGADDVGAVIIEAQQGEGGYLPPPPGYLEIVKQACEKHGALFIADEVQAGAGRTGKMWAIQHSSVIPDMLTWGKGMGGDMPCAGLTMRADLAAKIADNSQPNTWAGNAITAVVAMTNIDILTENGGELIARAGEVGEEVKARLQEVAEETPYIGEVRGRGLMTGIELVESKETRQPMVPERVGQVVVGLLQKGVIMVPCGRFGNVLRFMPPLTITREHCRIATDVLADVLRKV